MSTPYPPRYVPTLTEVVKFPDPNAVPLTPGFASSGLEVDAVTRDVLQAVAPLLEQRWRQMARALLEQQLDAQMPDLKRHLEAAVRQALDEALARRQDRDGS